MGYFVFCLCLTPHKQNDHSVACSRIDPICSTVRLSPLTFYCVLSRHSTTVNSTWVPSILLDKPSARTTSLCLVSEPDCKISATKVTMFSERKWLDSAQISERWLYSSFPRGSTEIKSPMALWISCNFFFKKTNILFSQNYFPFQICRTFNYFGQSFIIIHLTEFTSLQIAAIASGAKLPLWLWNTVWIASVSYHFPQ